MVNKELVGRRRRLPEQERRSQILEAAYRVACRDRLEAVTGRRVAEEAGLSSGLVFFHFQNKDELLLSLVDWVVDSILEGLSLDEGASDDPPREQLLSFIGRRIGRFGRARDRREVELFFDLWVMATRNAAVRARLRNALVHYREALIPIARDVIAADAARYGGVAPEALAMVATSLIYGSAVQAAMDPSGFDADGFLRALQAILGLPVAVGQANKPDANPSPALAGPY
jgi:TetR/AcrR family transcriptional regulator, transcriptional repressor of bet genes